MNNSEKRFLDDHFLVQGILEKNPLALEQFYDLFLKIIQSQIWKTTQNLSIDEIDDLSRDIILSLLYNKPIYFEYAARVSLRKNKELKETLIQKYSPLKGSLFSFLFPHIKFMISEYLKYYQMPEFDTTDNQNCYKTKFNLAVKPFSEQDFQYLNNLLEKKYKFLSAKDRKLIILISDGNSLYETGVILGITGHYNRIKKQVRTHFKRIKQRIKNCEGRKE